MDTTKRPSYRLVTVNTVPERAKRVIGRMVELLKDSYDIQYIDNCENIDEVVPKVTKHKPDVLFCASMWTPEEAETIQSLARSIVPSIKTHAIPTGLQVQGGPDSVVEYLVKNVPLLLG